jgi:hypothetical protein
MNLRAISVKFLFVTSIAVLSNLVSATNSSSSKSTTVSTDAAICSASAADRTIPTGLGEKEEYFVNIRNGDKVRSPFRVVFAVSGMGVAPVAAGNIEGTGHHHILIDLNLPPDIKSPIPFDKSDEYLHQHYKHFGKGETETVLNLLPGKHKLRLMFANYQHIPYYISSKEISIEVLPPVK